MTGTCESCGRSDEELGEVHRVYVIPSESTEPRIEESEDTEQWCASCRATYPHSAAR